MRILAIAPVQWFGGSFVRFQNISAKAKGNGIRLREIRINYQGKKKVMLDLVGYLLSVLSALRCSTNLVKRDSIQLIMSPVELPCSIVTSYLTAKLTNRPLAVVLNSTPLYGTSWNITTSTQIGTSFKAIYKETLYGAQSTLRAFLHAIEWYLAMKCLRSAYLICVSPIVLRGVISLGFRHNVLNICPGNGIDYEKINEIPSPKEKLFDGIYIGYLTLPKGIVDLIKIWKKIVEKISTAKLGIVASGSPEMARVITDYTKRLGLERNVTLLSEEMPIPQATVWRLMKGSKVLLHPSYKESWGLVIGEALACGLPVVVYDIPAIRFAYGKCKSVIRVSIGNIDEFSKKVCELITNSEVYNSLSRYAKLWSRKLSWEKVVEKELIIYREIIRRHYILQERL